MATKKKQTNAKPKKRGRPALPDSMKKQQYYTTIGSPDRSLLKEIRAYANEVKKNTGDTLDVVFHKALRKEAERYSKKKKSA